MSPQNTLNWLDTLSVKVRNKAYAIMQRMDEEVWIYYGQARKLSPSFGEISFGSAAFDATLKAALLEHFLSEIRHGANPVNVISSAQEYARSVIEAHNKRRCDVNWQRADTSGDAFILGLHRRFDRCMSQ